MSDLMRRPPLGQKQPRDTGPKPRKPLRQKTPMKAKAKRRPRADARHIEAVKLLPCAVCGAQGPSDAHHSISKRYSQRRAPDAFCIPLCKRHHQDGPEAIHEDKAAWEARHGYDFTFLPEVYRLLGKPIPPAVTKFLENA